MNREVFVSNDHRDYLTQYVAQKGWTRGAEIGVGTGKLAARLLGKVPGLSLVGVDLGRRADRVEQLAAIANKYPGRFTLALGPSGTMWRHFERASFDFVFIDAGHSYGAVATDIRCWRHMVRAGGELLGHDYSAPHFPGVVKAVDELCPTRTLHPHYIWSMPV